MKKNTVVIFFLLMIALVSCKNNISDTKNAPIPTTDNYKRIEKMYMDKVMKVAEGAVAKSYIEDFEMNGEKSGFVLTEKRLQKWNQNFVCGLWQMMKQNIWSMAQRRYLKENF